MVARKHWVLRSPQKGGSGALSESRRALSRIVLPVAGSRLLSARLYDKPQTS